MITGCFLACFKSIVAASSASYLVASEAASSYDYEIALENYLNIIEKKTANEKIYQESLLYAVITNQLSLAKELAEALDSSQVVAPTAGLFLFADAIHLNKFDKAQRVLLKYRASFPNILTTLLTGWTSFLNGDTSSGKNNFSSLGDEKVISAIGSYHLALALAFSIYFAAFL